MFGYVRPMKTELLVRELTRYRSAYCGICKEIGQRYGQLPRLAVGYDLTMLALLLLSLTDEQPPVEAQTCLVNPIQKRPMIKGGDVMAYCAALTVLLAYHKAADNVTDEATFTSKTIRLLLTRGYHKAKRDFPDGDRLITDHLSRLTALEQGPPDLSAARIFGDLLADLVRVFLPAAISEEQIREALVLFASLTGRWIYLCDAIDDLARDCNNENWNPFSGMDPESARAEADRQMSGIEVEMDRIAALLPYRRDAGILSNIVTLGLPSVRRAVLAGQPLGRL